MKKTVIIRDPRYGYLRVDPVPTREEVARYYRSDFYRAGRGRFNDSSLTVQRREREFHNSRWQAIGDICRSHFGGLRGLSLLDIGCGFAQALRYFRRQGIQTYGVEPSAQGVRYARKLGLNVVQGEIENLEKLCFRRQNIVALINVLEHLRHPAQTLIAVRKSLLNDRGLVVIDVPNDFNDFQVAADREHHLGQWWVCPPNHINYFTATSLKRLLHRCGYRVVHCETTFPLEMFLLFGEVYVGRPRVGRQCHRKRVEFERVLRKQGKEGKLRQLYRVLAELDLGRQVVAFATPQTARPGRPRS